LKEKETQRSELL